MTLHLHWVQQHEHASVCERTVQHSTPLKSTFKNDLKSSDLTSYCVMQEVGIRLENMDLVLRWEYPNMTVLVVFSCLTQPKRKFLFRPV